MSKKTQYDVNVFDLFARAFGYISLPYPLGDAGILSQLKERHSLLGTEILKNTETGEVFLPVTLVDEVNEYYLPYSTISMSFRNNIVSTELTERRGNVHELISAQDVVFNIRGIYIDRENDLPENALRDLSELSKMQKAVEIINGVTDYFLEDDQKIIISNMRLPAMKGQSGAQAYEIEAISDSNLILEIE
jgi:hypothetical protein